MEKKFLPIALLFLLWPSTLIWSMLNLKDSMFLFCVFMAIWQRKNLLLVSLFATLSVILKEGAWVLFPILIGMNNYRIGIVVALGILAYNRETVMNLPMGLSGTRCNPTMAMKSNTAYFQFPTDTWLSSALFLPLGSLAALFLPLLRPTRFIYFVATLESLAWWIMMPFVFKGLWKVKPLFILFLVWLFVLALSQGNMGTLLRQKALLYYLGFLCLRK